MSTNNNLIIGASLGGFKGLTIDEAMSLYLKLSDEFGLKAVEVRFEKEKERPSLWARETDKVKNFLSNFEVAGIHLPFVYLNPISPNPKIKKESIKQLKESIQKAAELGANYTVMHARGEALGLTQEEKIDKWIEVIKELTEFAKEHLVLLTLENADFLHDLSLLVKVVREINSKWLKITLDIGHAHIRKVAPLSTYPVRDVMLRALDIFLPLSLTRKNMPYEAYGSIKNFIKLESDLISVMHLHDYNGRHDHLSIGEGKINFSFLSELKEFKGPFIFEVGFENHYEDFKKNHIKFRRLMEK